MATPRPERPPAMGDVARLAGVSHQTVSRVLNDHPNVRPATRQRVLDAIARLGYRRNTAARALVTRRSGAIGVVMLSEQEFGPTSTFLAVEEAAHEAGYYLSVATMPHPGSGDVARVLEHFLGLRVEGVIVIAPLASVAEMLRPFAAQVPLVTIAAGAPRDQEFHPISVDQILGARLAVRHLLELGHRDVVHVSGPQDWFDAQQRVVGWRAELAAHGVVPGDPVVADWTAGRGYEIGRQLARARPPTAIFAANDQLALGLLHALTEAGLDVPRDVSVVGFDDVPGSAHFRPPLTTVRQDFEGLGRSAIEMLLEAIAGAAVAREAIRPQLVVRASTGPRGPT